MTETYCDVCGQRDSYGCGHDSHQRREARAHNESAEHLSGACYHFRHDQCGDDCQHAGDDGHRPGFMPMVHHAAQAAKNAQGYSHPVFPSKAAEDLFARRGTFAAKCESAEQAECEIQRLLNGIDGFEDCTLLDVSRMEPDADGNFGGWSGEIDDPEDECELRDFTIFDDGDMDWS